MTKRGSSTRRVFLGGLAVTPATLAAAKPVEALQREFTVWGDEPIALVRTEQGRRDSEFRYHNAEAFFATIEQGLKLERNALLYHAGIVMQLALSSHLLDVGFQDQWCARHIGLRVSKSLAYANATGLGYRHAEAEQLAAILTPYCKWNSWPSLDGSKPEGCPFDRADVTRIARELLDHVCRVTGHRRAASR